MKTTEEIIEKIHEMMEEEKKAFEGCDASRKWWESKGDFENAEFMKTNEIRHLRGYTQLAKLLDFITGGKQSEEPIIIGKVDE